MTRPARIAATTEAVAACVLGLTGCGGKSSAGTNTSSTTGASRSGGGQGQRGILNDAKVQACLKAAGISIPTRANGARPSGSFSGFPSGARPSGSRGPGGRFGGNSAEAQKIRAALEVCGITLPTGGARPPGTTTPTATPAN